MELELDLLVHGRLACIDHRTWTTYGRSLVSYYRLRRKMFGIQYWDVVRSFHGMEFDQYDTPAATSLVWIDREQRAWAGLRLTPTTHRYMLKDNWPDMCADQPPASPSVWEVTRLCVDDQLTQKTRRLVRNLLVCGLIEFGIMSDIDHFVAVTPPKLWASIFENTGCAVQYLGPERVLGKQAVRAGQITANIPTLLSFREATHIDFRVLEEWR